MDRILPMLCEPSPPFDDDNYSFEIKWDGERSVLFFEPGKLLIQNREGVDVTYRYPELQRLANGKNAILDGEICVISANKPGGDFELLAQRSHLQKKFDIELRMTKLPVIFIGVDILSFDNTSLVDLPLIERREILYKYFPPVPPVFQWSLPLDKEGKGTILFEQAKAIPLEGIIGKRLDSPYLGRRSPYWKKCKILYTMDLEFKTYTVNNAGIRIEREDGIKVQVAGGNSRIVRKRIDERGSALIEVEYLNLTKNGKLRQPTFKTLKGT